MSSDGSGDLDELLPSPPSSDEDSMDKLDLMDIITELQLPLQAFGDHDYDDDQKPEPAFSVGNKDVGNNDLTDSSLRVVLLKKISGDRILDSAAVYLAYLWKRNTAYKVIVKHANVNDKTTISNEFENIKSFARIAEKSDINVVRLEPALPELYRLRPNEDPNEEIYMLLLQYVPGPTVDQFVTLENLELKSAKMCQEEFTEILMSRCRDICVYVKELCIIVMEIHAARWTHDDVSPKNVIISDRTKRAITLLDFGSSMRIPVGEGQILGNTDRMQMDIYDVVGVCEKFMDQFKV